MAESSSSAASPIALNQLQRRSRSGDNTLDLERNTPRDTGGRAPDNVIPDEKYSYLLDDDFSKLPRGWPRFAQEQNFLHNGGLHRRFGYIFQRILYRMENRIAGLEKRLIDLEYAQENDPGSTELQGQSKDPYSLLDDIEILVDRYTSLLIRDKELRTLAPVTRAEVDNMNKAARSKSGMLRKEDCLFMEAVDDFISTRAERTYYPIQWLIYGRANPAIQKLVFGSKKTKERLQGAFDTYYSSDNIKLFLKFIVAFFCGILLLAPVFILYLVSLTKVQSVGVVVAFVFVFSLVLSLPSAIKIDTILVGLSAYMAVLVTFLANLASGGELS